MKTSQTRNFNGKIIPFDTYSTEILQRLEQVTTAEGVGHGYIIQTTTETDIIRHLHNFIQNNDCEVHGLRVSVIAGTTYFLTIPESYRRHFTYLVHCWDKAAVITEFSNLEEMFKIAAPITATRRLDKGRRPKSRLILSTAKNDKENA